MEAATGRRKLGLTVALLLCVIAASMTVLLVGRAAAQSDTGTISLKSDHAATTNSHGEAERLRVLEGEHLVLEFSIREPRSEAAGTVGYRLLSLPDASNPATQGDDFPVTSGVITLRGDGSSDIQPTESVTIPIPWEWQGAGTSEPNEQLVLEFYLVTGQLRAPSMRDGTPRNVFPITIVNRNAPITVNASSSSPVNADDGVEVWHTRTGLDRRNAGRIEFLVEIPRGVRRFIDDVTIDYEIVPGTAEPGRLRDYVVHPSRPAKGKLTFRARDSGRQEQTEQSIWIDPVDDNLVEAPEVLRLVLSNPTNGMEFPDLDGDGKADETVTVEGIILSDDLVSMTVANATVTEGAVAQMTLTLERELREGESADVTASLVSDGACGGAPGATRGVDYRDARPATITFGPGDRVKTFEVQTLEDTRDEDRECLVVAFQYPEQITLMAGGDQHLDGRRLDARIYIEDNDDPPTLYFTSRGAFESDPGEPSVLRFFARLSNPSGRDVSINYADALYRGLNPAISGVDYVALTPGTLTFTPGEVEKSVTVTVTGDYDEEPHETMGVRFFSPVNTCLVGTGSCPGGAFVKYERIVNDDNNVKVSIAVADDTLLEGDDAVMRVTLSRPTKYDFRVHLLPTGGTATVGDDYGSQGDSTNGYYITVPRNRVTATHIIPTHSDGVSGEGIETITLSLSDVDLDQGSVTDAVVHQELFGSGGIRNVIDNTSVPTLKILDGLALSVTAEKGKVTEGQPVRLRATLNRAASADVTFNWKTEDGGPAADSYHTAKAGRDYTARPSQQVTIPAGTTSVDLPPVQTLQDSVDEYAQQFIVVLDSINGALANDVRQVVIIRDDDPRPWLSIGDAAAEEGGILSFDVTLSAASEKLVAFQWVTEQDTATTAAYIQDYVGVDILETVTFAPGERSKTLMVQSVDDARPEPSEQFLVQVAKAPEAKLRDPTATGTIRDNEKIEISIADAAEVEEDSGQNAVFTVTMNPPQTAPVTIQWKTEDEAHQGTFSATGGSDYTAQELTGLTFAAGETEKTISVPIIDDVQYENTETFRVVLSGDASRIAFPSAAAYAEIADDESKDIFFKDVRFRDPQNPPLIDEGTTSSRDDDPRHLITIQRDLPDEDDLLRLRVQNDQISILMCLLDRTDPRQFLDRSYPPPPPGAQASQADHGDYSLRRVIAGDPPTFVRAGLWNCSRRGQGELTPVLLWFPTGREEMQLALAPRGDSTPEGNEVLTIWLWPHTGFWEYFAPEHFTHGLALSVIIVDDDRPQASIEDVAVKENVGRATMTVTLNQVSSQQVSVKVGTREGTAAAGQDYAAVSRKLTFLPGETSKTIDVPIVEDGRVEPEPETFFVVLSDPSHGLNVHPTGGEAAVTIQDTSKPTLTVPDRVVDEGGTATVLFSLSDPVPTGFNTARLSWLASSAGALKDTDFTAISGTQIRFRPGDSHLTRTIATIEDDLIETDENILGVVLLPPDFNLLYQGRPSGIDDVLGSTAHPFLVVIRDDDEGSLSVSGYEDGTVRAGREWTSATPAVSGNPIGHVTWTLEGADAGDFVIDADTGLLTLPPQTFDSPVDSNQDNIYQVTVRATDEDGNTDSQSLQVAVNAWTLLLSHDSLTVAEKDGTASYTAELDARPASDVTIDFTLEGDTGALALDKTSLTFTPSDWNRPQTVTVTGVDDSYDNEDDRRTAVIVHAGSGGGVTESVEYRVAVTITDEDEEVIIVSTDSLTVAENGGTASYTVALSAKPTADEVEVLAFVPAVHREKISLGKEPLTFTPENWDQPQTVTVTGLNDDVDNTGDQRVAEIANFSVDFGPPGVNRAGRVKVTVTDDDERGVTVSKRFLEVDEGTGTNSYTVVLNSEPDGGNVKVALKGSGESDDWISYTSGPLTFTASNWNQPQTVTVGGKSLSGSQSPVATIEHTVIGADYTGVEVEDVLVLVKADSSNPLVTVTGGEATEGDDVEFTVRRITSDPGTIGDDVVESFTWYTRPYTGMVANGKLATAGADYTAVGSAGEQVLVNFPPGEDTATISVKTRDDQVVEDNEFFLVTVTATGSTQSVDAIGGILDNETKSWSLLLSTDSLTLPEKDGTTSYTARLNSKPKSDATIVITLEGDTEALALDKASLTFTPGDWNQPQTVTVTGVDDSYDNEDDRRAAVIVHAGSGSGATQGAEYRVAVTITDEDEEGFTVSTNSLTVAENGGTASYTVRLDSKPTVEEVTVLAFLPGVHRETVSVDKDTLIFTPDDWDQPQTVTVTGLNDDVDNTGDQRVAEIANLAVNFGPSDLSLEGRVEVTVTDDDERGVTISKRFLEVEVGGSKSYTVRLNSEPDRGRNVKVTLNGSGVGYTPSSRELTFTASNWNQPQTVMVQGGRLDRGVRSRVVTIQHAVTGTDYTGVDVEDVLVLVKAYRSDALLSVTGGEATEGDDVEFTVRRLNSNVAFFFWYTGPYTGTVAKERLATAGDDYTSVGSEDSPVTVNFPSGQDTVTISVKTKDDYLVEESEFFLVTVTGYDGSSVQTFDAIGGILDKGSTSDDGRPTLSVGDAAAVTEGNDPGKTVNMSFPVALSASDGKAVTVTYTLGGTATAGEDYTAPNPLSLTIPAESDTGDIVIPVKGDALFEGDETVVVTLTEVTNATVADGEATGTITDDDGATAVASVGDAAAVTEGNDPGKTVNMSFEVSLSAVSGRDVTVTYTLGGTATAGSDYTAPDPLSVSVPAGSRTANIVVPVKGDTLDEANETVVVTLTGATNAALSETASELTATGTITDDDGAPQIIVVVKMTGSPDSTLLTVAENVATAPTFTVTVTLEGNTFSTDREVTVSVGKAGDSAVSGTDYEKVDSFSITIAAGESSAEVEFTLDPIDDTLDEDDETVTVTTTLDNSVVSEVTLTITDDDGLPELSIGDASAAEGSGVAFTITLSPASGREVTVKWTTASDDDGDHPATAVTDYTAVTQPQTVTFAAGETSKRVNVGTVQDTLDEEDETFLVRLSTPTNATLAAVVATGTIADDDGAAPAAAALTVSPSSVVEGGGGDDGVEITVTATLGSGSTFSADATVTVGVGKAGDSAVSGADYEKVDSFDITIPAGQSSGVGSFTLVAAGDGLDEEDEKLTVADAQVTLTDADDPPVVSVGDAAAVAEGDDPAVTVNMSFRVTLSAVSGRDVTVAYGLGGTATAGTDYAVPNPLSLTIAAGDRTGNIVIPVKGDLVDEAPETVTVTLTGATNAELSTSATDLTGSGTITDDDPTSVTLSLVDTSAEEGNKNNKASVMLTLNRELNEGESIRVPLLFHEVLPDIDPDPDGGKPRLWIMPDLHKTFIREGDYVTFTVHADRAPTSPLTVRLKVLDSLGTGYDYLSNDQEGSKTVVIEAGARTAYITLFTTDDSTDERVGGIEVEIEQSEDYIAEIFYAGPTRGHRSHYMGVLVFDDDPTTVELTTLDTTATEGSAHDTARLTLTLNRGIYSWDGERLEVPLLFSGGALGRDFTLSLSGSPHGVSLDGNRVIFDPPLRGPGDIALFDVPSAREVTLLLTALPDGDTESKVVTVDIPSWWNCRNAELPDGRGTTACRFDTSRESPYSARGMRGGVMGSRAGDGRITLLEVPEVNITAASGGAEGGTATFTITANPEPDAGLDVSVTVLASGDYGVSTGTRTVTIPTTGSATLTLTTDDDAVDEPDGTVTVALNPGSDYTVGTLSSETVVILDNDDPPAQQPNDDSAATTCVTTDQSLLAQVEAKIAEHQSSDRSDLLEMFTRSYDTMQGNDDYTTADIRARPDKQGAVWQANGPNALWQSIYAELDRLEACRASKQAEPEPTPPEVSISGGSDISEGGDAVFTLTASPPPGADLDVSVTVSASGDYGVTTSTQTVMIPTSGAATFTVSTTDDAVDEADGSVTVTLNSGAGYTVDASASSGTVAVTDDDDPTVQDTVSSITTEELNVNIGGKDTIIEFTVTLSEPAPTGGVAVGFTGEGSGWIANPAYDYSIKTSESVTDDKTDEYDTVLRGTLTIGHGETQGTIQVIVHKTAYIPGRNVLLNVSVKTVDGEALDIPLATTVVVRK